MSPIEQLLAVLHAYAAATGLAEATVSRRFLGGGGRSAQLRAGGDMGARTLVGALERFSDEWPEGADWPVGVERPGCAGGEAFLPPERPRHSPKPAAEAGRLEAGEGEENETSGAAA